MSDAGFFELIKDWILVPVAGFATWAWNHNEAEHKSIREAQEKQDERLRNQLDSKVNEAIKFAREEDSRIMNEMETQRGHIAKIFDKLEEHARRSEDRHVEMLGAIHEGLSRKADK